MSLATELSAVLDNFEKNAPEGPRTIITKARTDFQDSYDPSTAIQVGDTLPEFALSNAVGAEVKSASLLSQGPLLITFYRGNWCPFCNIALAGFQKHLDEIKSKGVTLVAISPELPTTALSTAEKHALQYPVLSDVGNKFAKKLGIVWAQPDSLRPVLKAFGHDLAKTNGDDSFEVPVPATLLVDQKGIVRNTFIESNYTKRLEPSVALEWINAL